MVERLKPAGLGGLLFFYVSPSGLLVPVFEVIPEYRGRQFALAPVLTAAALNAGRIASHNVPNNLIYLDAASRPAPGLPAAFPAPSFI